MAAVGQRGSTATGQAEAQIQSLVSGAGQTHGQAGALGDPCHEFCLFGNFRLGVCNLPLNAKGMNAGGEAGVIDGA